MSTEVFATAYTAQVGRWPDPNEAWNTIRAGAGNSLVADANTGWMCSNVIENAFSRLDRAILVFDTSSLGGATVTGATLTITLSWGVDELNDNPAFNIYNAAPTDPAAIVKADYGNCGSTAYAASSWSPSLPTESDEHTYTLNATGVAAVDSSGYTCVCVRDVAHDVAGLAPTYGTGFAQTAIGFTAELSVTYLAVPIVETQPPSWSETSAKLKGYYASPDDATVTVRFQYGLTGGYGSTTSWLTRTGTTGTFFANITGLTAGTTYHFQAQTTNDNGTGSGSDVTFTTNASDTSVSTSGYIWIEGGYLHFIDGNGVERTGIVKTDFDAHTVLAANTDNVPNALTIDASSVLGRASGNIDALTGAEVMALLSDSPTAAFDLNGQELQGHVLHVVANATAREALTATVGMWVYQDDDDSLYVCTAV